MKRFLTLIVAGLIPVLMFSQAQLTTKKAKFSDFPEKVMKVVLSGNDFIDSEFKNSINDCWKFSPYEFCTLSEFETLKSDDDYYFLMLVSGQFRKETEPGLTLLTMFKGGKGSDKSLDKMLEVGTLPFCSIDNPSGREIVFFPALIEIMQDHIQAIVKTERFATVNPQVSSKDFAGISQKKIVFAESDINFEITDSFAERLNVSGIEILPDDDVDDLMLNGAEDTVVSFSVYPDEAVKGSYSYNLLINAQTHKLYYFRKHKNTKGMTAGFLKDEVSRFTKK